MRKYFILFLSLLSQLGYGGSLSETNSSNLFAEQESQDMLSSEEQKAQRGLSNLSYTFIPKGLWMVGGTFSYATHTNDDYSLVMVEGIDSYGYNFKVTPIFTYAIANNITVGGRLGYNRNLFRIDNSDLIYGDPDDGGIHITMDNYHLITHGFTAMAILRQYIPLGNNKRFAIFNEIQLEGGYSQSKHTYDAPVQGTYSTTNNIALNLAPGITAFATDRVAVEVNVGMLGLSHSRTKQTHNQVSMGNIDSNSLNFKINILAINFGVSYHFSSEKR